MSHNLKLNDVEEVIAGIRDSLSNANQEIVNWDVRDREVEEVELAKYYVERAFVQTLTFLEAAELSQLFSLVAEVHREAKEDYAEYSNHPEGAYLIWSSRLEPYLRALETNFSGGKTGRVVKEIIEILRATQYSITDRACFKDAPKDEADVHSRIEAVLRCVFPDLRRKPPIAKPIKNFEPDTGIPSLRTLIEYKYVESDVAVKRVVDEILADTRGYRSKEWDRFIYVIYETTRLKPESQWRQMLRENQAAENTEIIVISGEAPTTPPAARK